MYGVKLQYGGDEQEDHPLVVDIGEVCHQVVEKVDEEAMHRVHHGDAREDEAEVGEVLYVLQSADSEIVAFIDLGGLCHGEQHRA